MRTLTDVFDSWETLTEMAADVRKNRAAVEKWRERQSIPLSAWPLLMKALKRKGKDIGAADLLAMHTRSKSSPVSQPHNGRDAA
jgi:hypothetical protein